jgi:hypothetical protein
MFERFRQRPTEETTEPARTENGRTAVAERPVETGDDTAATRRIPTAPRGTATTGPAAAGLITSERMHAMRERQRATYGGFNWGAAFFGWLVAVGLGALLVGLIAAAGAAVGLEISSADAVEGAEEIGVGGAIALTAALVVAYAFGGYVAGRLSRFDGARQGLGAWIFGLLVTAALAVIAVIFGSEYNVLERLDLPRLPIGDEEFATAGWITLAAVALGTLLAGIGGGKAGERYHRKVDRVGLAD